MREKDIELLETFERLYGLVIASVTTHKITADLEESIRRLTAMIVQILIKAVRLVR